MKLIENEVAMARHFALPVILSVLASAMAPSGALAEGPAEHRLCVFDPAGTSGDAYRLMGDFQTSALEWGVRFDLRPFTDEEEAARAFEAGDCTAVLVTGLRARSFNSFAGTVEAIGAVPDYALLKRVVSMLANPRAARRMVSGDHETAAIFPAGAVYLYLRDRSMASAEGLSGKGIATIETDRAASTLVRRAGAELVSAEVGTFASIFNEGRADGCYAPATAFQPLELERGVSSGGGVVRYPLSQLTLQLVVRHEALPDDFGEQARRYAARNFDQMIAVVRRADQSVPAGYWIDLPDEEKAGFDELFREVRIQLRDAGVYDGAMLTLLRRVRCQVDESRPECSEELD